MARIALDAMGGDNAPREVIAGAVLAAGRGVDVVLVGDEGRLAGLMSRSEDALPVVHAPEVIDMHEDPAAAIREKKQASVRVAAKLVADREAAGMVSAGSTGAAMAAAALVIGRLPGVSRPAIATIIPGIESPTVVLDSGANIECRPEHLAQFAVMGAALAATYIGVERPTVGLLNIGEEEGKGRELEKAAFPLLAASSVEFVGNVEGRDLASRRADVFVTDGFTGNVLLKAAEGTARMVVGLAAAGGGAIAELADRLDPESYGGAHLVGSRGVVVIAHGSSSRVVIANALEMAAEGAKNGLVDRIAAGLAR
ncbi:MAG: phosphate acyltransferase PlsX [Acidimicrobiia bacterium]